MGKAPPAFQFYPNDFVSGTRRLTTAQVGGYILLLCAQWDDGSIPGDDMTQLALIMRCSKQAAEVHWSILQTKFVRDEYGQWRNPRLEAVRKAQEEFRQQRATAGQHGAQKRWHKHSETIAEPMANAWHSHAPANGKRIAEGMANGWRDDGSSYSNLQSPNDQIKKRSDRTYPPDEEFAQFWANYPKKTGKLAAQTAWRNAKDRPEIGVILQALEWQRQSPQWLKDGGQYVPNPATYIAQGRWLDEKTDTPQVSEKNARSLGAIYGDD